MGVPYAEVIGDPVNHSKSPLIHKFWLGKLGQKGEFRSTPVAAGELVAFFEVRRRDPDWRGCSVTLPHKEQVLPLLDRLEEDGVGAVNCVVPRQGRLTGFNTDRAGIDRVLGEVFGPGAERDPSVCLIGAGGGARAVMAALRDIERGRVNLIVRDPSKGGALLERFGLSGKAYRFGEAQAALAGCPGLINATPLGMTGAPDMPASVLNSTAALHPDAFVFDMVYAPLRTSLLARAAAAGLETIDGLDMLIGQAEQAFFHFYGSVAPAEHEPELLELLTR